MKNKKLIIVISGLLIIAAALICGFSCYKMDIISDKVNVELGRPLEQTVSKYATGNISGARLDLTNVDVQKTGVYEAYVSNNIQKLSFEVDVVDSIPPSAEKIDGLSFHTNMLIKANELVTNIWDESSVIVTFFDGKNTHTYTNGGAVTESILLTDETGNRTELNITFQVVADVNKPVLKGIKAITSYAGDEIDYLKGISAIDDRDGDLTSMVKVDANKVNIENPGSYYIVYSVSDSSNNKTSKKAKVTILEDTPPLLEGTIDKTIYVNSKINYFDGVTAKDDRDGNLTSLIKVDSTKVRLEKAGNYTVTYTVKDSAGHLTKKTIKVVVKNKETTPSGNGKQSKTSDKNNESDRNNETNRNKDTSSGFQLFDVKPSGNIPNGDVPASGEHVGKWD